MIFAAPSSLLLRKQARGSRLYACKRARRLCAATTFCVVREFNPHRQNVKNIFIYGALTRRRRLHIACGDFSFEKSPARSFNCVSFLEKGHTAPLLLACKRARNALACYRPFSGVRGCKSTRQKALNRLFRPEYT